MDNQELFDLMSQEHGLALLETEMNDIIQIALKVALLGPKHKGMRVDHSGILGRIANGCKVRSDQRWMLGELDKHLKEAADRFYSGDISAVDELFQLYCLDDKRPSVEGS